jgi:hypothetical protein
MPFSNEKDRRVSSAIGYLTAEVRARPTLEIRCRTIAERLIWNGRQAVGAVVPLRAPGRRSRRMKSSSAAARINRRRC